MNATAQDKEGFLRDRSQWNPDVATALAAEAGIELTETHWLVLHLARDFYARTGLSPEMRPLVKIVREALGPDTGSSIGLMQLFPPNPAKQVARIGGLPKPTNCL